MAWVEGESFVDADTDYKLFASYANVVDLGLDDATEELLDFERLVWNRQLEIGIYYCKVSLVGQAVLVVYLVADVDKAYMEEVASAMKLVTKAERVCMGFSQEKKSPILQYF